MARRWIRGAIKRPGAFTRKASTAGMGVQAFDRRVIARGTKQYSLRTVRQAVLARTLGRISRRRR